jgi:hypothetical protein
MNAPNTSLLQSGSMEPPTSLRASEGGPRLHPDPGGRSRVLGNRRSPTDLGIGEADGDHCEDLQLPPGEPAGDLGARRLRTSCSLTSPRSFAVLARATPWKDSGCYLATSFCASRSRVQLMPAAPALATGQFSELSDLVGEQDHPSSICWPNARAFPSSS